MTPAGGEDAVPVDRRAFLTTCALAGSALLLGGCVASLVTHPVAVTGGTVRIRVADFPDLAKPDGAVKLQPAGFGDPVYVLADAGGFRAVSPICTHRGCTVDVHGPRLVCPCHGSTYDREGRVLRGPAERALTAFPVAREGDTLIIRLA